MAIDTTKNYKQVTIVTPQKVTLNYFANLATKATPASTDEVVLIDNAAGGAVKRSTVAQQAANGVNVPRSSGSAVYAIDASALGSAIVIANNGTATPFGAGTALRGLIAIWSNGDGVGALLFADSSGASIISDRANIFAVAAGTASKINVYVTGGALTIENKRGSSVTVSVVGFRFA